MPPKDHVSKSGKKKGDRSGPDRSARNPVIDEGLRQRISKRHLEDLERDNFTTMDEVETQDPSAGRKTKRFDSVGEEGVAPAKRSKKGALKRTSSISLKKNLASLIQESKIETLPPDVPTYLTAAVGPSTLPPRKFCSVCGYFSSYACITCGMKYCSMKCKGAHEETRCMKFTIG